MSKPYLFIDVDGVVSPLPAVPGEHAPAAPGYFTYDGAPYAMCFPEHLLDSFARLVERFDVHWLTSWEQSWLGVAERLGLPERPVLPLGRGTGRAKLAALAAVVERAPRRFAWVDDELAAPAVRRARQRLGRLGIAWLALRPDRLVGMTSAEVEVLLAWAAERPLPATSRGAGDDCRRVRLSVVPAGVDPATSRFSDGCSAN